ncbi:hypothetical protein LH442_01795 [Laribacter hongkongensis]|uniref:hypothetical protein n=1 Tax=Laribacter hongkongensis TaxID=168471 RepID=UPI001EFCB070|nr:hypothetical protein [Laribacter hongkongensis]MCG9054734.1 hypothetical protein [Laribacter hongkongensis]
MNSAIDRYTGQIVDGEQLWYIDPVDKEGYICRGCGVMVNPVSFEIHHKKRPHFKELLSKPHKSWCDAKGEEKLIVKARKERVTTQAGFPGSFPSKLQLIDEREKVNTLGVPIGGTGTSSGGTSSGTTTGKAHTQWTAHTIRPICRKFMNFPNDRDLPLSVPGAYGSTYDEVIRKLASRDIVAYPKQHIFVAPLSWSKAKDVAGKIVVELSYGFWANKKLAAPYRLIVDSTSWSAAKKNYVLNELEVSREEAKERAAAGRKSEKSWVFFVGQQDLTSPSDFVVSDHRLICCLTGEL